MIINIPHSSIVIPDTSNYSVDVDLDQEINRVTDWYSKELFSHEKYYSLVFPYSRLYCDVERFEDDALNLVGQGIYYTKTLDGRDLRKNDPIEHEKVMKLYKKHHLELTEYVNEHIRYFDKITIIDAHTYSDEQASIYGGYSTPDFCIGVDTFHTPDELVLEVCKYLSDNGFSYAINEPFVGTIIPTYFYKKNSDVQSIMLEVNKRLYLTDDYKKSENFNNLKSHISVLLTKIKDITLS